VHKLLEQVFQETAKAFGPKGSPHESAGH
jgi:hypothetical protein